MLVVSLAKALPCTTSYSVVVLVIYLKSFKPANSHPIVIEPLNLRSLGSRLPSTSLSLIAACIASVMLRSVSDKSVISLTTLPSILSRAGPCGPTMIS